MPGKAGFARSFDRLAGFPADQPELAADLLDTAMLRPLGLVTTSLGFMTMSAAALAITHRGWAAMWVGVDVAMLAARSHPAVRAWRTGVRIPADTARVILTLAFAMFTAFGLGCAASFATGIEALRIASAVAVMGLVAGLATRWAALPRLAALLIAAASLPMAVVIAPVSTLAAALFVLVVVGTGVLLVQNNRHLMGMLRAEREARRLAGTDALTGLLNRAGLNAGLDRVRPPPVAQGSAPLAEETDIAVMFVDLDGFKAVNDRFGHAAGDLVLAEVGRRIAALTGGHLAARVGGDEFVTVLTGAVARSPDAFAAALRVEIGRPVPLAIAGVEAGTIVRVGASVGVATGSLATCDPQAMLASADAALYADKRAPARPNARRARKPHPLAETIRVA